LHFKCIAIGVGPSFLILMQHFNPILPSEKRPYTSILTPKSIEMTSQSPLFCTLSSSILPLKSSCKPCFDPFFTPYLFHYYIVSSVRPRFPTCTPVPSHLPAPASEKPGATCFLPTWGTQVAPGVYDPGALHAHSCTPFPLALARPGFGEAWGYLLPTDLGDSGSSPWGL